MTNSATTARSSTARRIYFRKTRYANPGGKELTMANGLNEYDFGARQYYSAVPGFTKPDPMCEKFQHLSPYLFCGNDPVNNVDPNGEVFEIIWDIGNVVYDVGAAIYHHATGNHVAAMENWMDAGLDVAAVIIPGLPADTSKAGKKPEDVK